MPEAYEPVFPAYTARFPKEVKDIVMVTIGAQHPRKPAKSALPTIIEFLQQVHASCRPEGWKPSPPYYWEPASVTDSSGAYNEVVIAYWQSESEYRRWASDSAFEGWWNSLNAEKEEHGWFLEIFLPSVDRFEALFSCKSDSVNEGASYMRTGLSGPIQEYVYWGSMRDRLPVAQTDALQGTKDGRESKHTNGETAPVKQRLRVHGKKNLAVIRSGQDWSNTTPQERKKYLETMHPVLVKGMSVLRDHGDEVGCFNCRLMDVLDSKTLQPGIDKTFGFAYFDDLASLEGWSKQHPTHLAIFGRFLQYVKELHDDNNEVSLRLFHEVLVLEPRQQYFEYVGCHGQTGMLAGT